MSKKTLNEATVRQFMKLVNHKPDTISNFISERYDEGKKDKDKKMSDYGNKAGPYSGTNPQIDPKDIEQQKKAAEMDPSHPMHFMGQQNEGYNEELDEELDEMAPVAEEEEDADPVGDEMPPMDDKPAGMKGEVDITPEQAEVLIELGEMLKGAMGDEMDDMGDDMDDEPEAMDAMPPMGDEPAADAGADDEMNEEEMIQEVARRVAARILKAKNAKKELDEELGNK